MIIADPAAVIQKVSRHPKYCSISPIATAVTAGPNPHDAIRKPIPTPRCRLNQFIADGISGTRNTACATPSRTPNTA